ncbi:crocetin glucosyltransferase chloroplastic-like [Tripterygium wilfordii]|uniref:Glycosyltransferase n=1 Tax=Tripterygium wilfordii TaxID=458696 RepID=A0A7J7DVA9_TRIWF|nr:UDP-glycosyltransferase 75C1-like [Tripterygium wilfordii]KAF5750241.1 crocetin glucosyltransferase chloroplastic-like [Tripterygium wilfordii]
MNTLIASQPINQPRMSKPHILIVTFPGQGHINPTLQFAKRLIRTGATVTFATTISAHRRMPKDQTTTPKGLSFATFSDGCDQGFKPNDDIEHFMFQFKHYGIQNLRTLITTINQDRPITRVVYSLLLPWVATVASEFHIPSTLLWNQPAALLNIYYRYFNGYGGLIKERVVNDPSFSVELPGLPPLTSVDLPSFFLPSNVYAFALPLFKEHLEILNSETNPKVLVNTFDELEFETLKALDKYNLVGVGPLIPSAFLDETDPSDTCFGGDLFKKGSNDYTDWLNSKDSGSVVYVSFGSLSVLAKPQMEEMARALLHTGRPFLWVIREQEGEGTEKEELSCRGDLEKQGMIVPWCSQVEVLSHSSIGCFVSHCGWNSTFESLTCGVPMVGFPQWTDQPTNAKLVQDVWKTGVRVAERDDGLVETDEIKRCLDLVMGSNEGGEEIRRNAKKWKALAKKAAMEGGSSDKHLKTFVEEAAQE